MKPLLLAAIAIGIVTQQAQQQDTKPVTYTEPYVGLTFSHPSDWTMTKKAKDRVIFAIPVPGTTESAELQVVHTQFHADKEIFQTAQLDINKQLNREVERQWEQEVLGVPFLFTKINYVDKDGISRSVLTGLYYTRTPEKLLIRLETRKADYDSVAYIFDQTMQTLSTPDGKMPQADDPAVKLDAAPKKPTPPPPPPKLIDGGVVAATVKPAGSAEVTVSSRKVNLLYPEGWKVEKVDGNTVTISNAGLSKPLQIQLFSTLDSDPAKKALFKASSVNLDAYTTVDSREDTADNKNKAGAVVSTTWRLGKTSKGDLASFYAVGQSGEFYFLISYEQTDMPTYRNERKVLQDFVDLLTIEPAP